MFDIVIKGVAVTDPFESETGRRLETLNKACVRRSKSATYMCSLGMTPKPPLLIREL